MVTLPKPPDGRLDGRTELGLGGPRRIVQDEIHQDPSWLLVTLTLPSRGIIDQFQIASHITHQDHSKRSLPSEVGAGEYMTLVHMYTIIDNR